MTDKDRETDPREAPEVIGRVAIDMTSEEFSALSPAARHAAAPAVPPATLAASGLILTRDEYGRLTASERVEPHIDGRTIENDGRNAS